MEILTVDELATWLKMSKGQIYEMTKERTRSGAMRDNPIPVLKINGNVRFRRASIDEWLKLTEQKAA
jgi:excisionase family DNA binding protein